MLDAMGSSDGQTRLGRSLIVVAQGSCTAVVAALFLAACAEEPFEPIQQSDFEFSIYGFLDASADTQWVRVTGLKTNVLPDSNVIDASVTLEHLGTGEVTTLYDSLFAHGTSLYAWNFWTDVPMQQGATYRITADRSEGGTSFAMARVAVDADTVVVRVGADGHRSRTSAQLRTIGAEYVAMVHVLPKCKPTSVTYQWGGPTVAANENGEIEGKLHRRLLCPVQDTIYSSEIWMAFSGSPWAYDPEWSRVTAFLPEAASNVDEGLGFFGGVLTRTIPFETCHIIGAGPGDECDLVYTDQVTGVEGIVQTTRVGEGDECRYVPLWKRVIFLWEDRPDEVRSVRVENIFEETIQLHEPDGTTVRSAYTERDGTFKISALEPGIPYSLAVSYGNEPDYFRPGTFTVQEGETLSLDVELPGECF